MTHSDTEKAVSETFRNDLTGMLKFGMVKIDFTKIDGSDRTMVCTLNEQFLNSQEGAQTSTDQENPKKKRKINENVIAVWDTEKNGWRSIRLDSIKNIIALP